MDHSAKITTHKMYPHSLQATNHNDNGKYFISALTKQQIELYRIRKQSENSAKTRQQINAVETIQNNSIYRYRRPSLCLVY